MSQDFIDTYKKSNRLQFVGRILVIFLLLGGIWIFSNFSKESTGSEKAEIKVVPQQAQSVQQTSHAQNPEPSVNALFEEGKHYQRLPASITTHKSVQEFIAQNPNKIQVIEFFNYGCFWCQQLHPVLNEWAKKKPKNVEFYRYPVVFNKFWEPLAKDYLVVSKLGKNDILDPLFFTEIHQKRVNLSDEKLLKSFLAKNGVSVEKFFQVFNSFEVNTEMAKINDIGQAYQITLSPSIVLNAPSGSYLFTATMAGGDRKLIELLNFLIERESSPTPNH